MKDELLAIIPEIADIKDDNLREQCISAFLDAMQIAGRTPAELAKMPFTLLISPCSVSFVDHTRRVTRTALAIAEVLAENWQDEDAMELDRDILLATALLHDVGKILEYEREANGNWRKSGCGKLLRHPVSGAGICMKWGLPDTVVHGVMYHSHEGDGIRATTEAIIVNHADFLNFEPLKLKYG
jgi:putative nucleotidyltransferase with HDIG domain